MTSWTSVVLTSVHRSQSHIAFTRNAYLENEHVDVNSSEPRSPSEEHWLMARLYQQHSSVSEDELKNALVCEEACESEMSPSVYRPSVTRQVGTRIRIGSDGVKICEAKYISICVVSSHLYTLGTVKY